MKNVLALLIAITLTAFTACHYQHKLDNQALTQNVYAIWGEGDQGEEFNYALLNGTPETMESLMRDLEYETYNDGEAYPEISYDCERNLLKKDTDKRGFVSVVFEQREEGRIDTLALDYLTSAEFDTLVSHSIEF